MADAAPQEDAPLLAMRMRAEAAERRLAVYNSGGFADADALAEKYLELSNALASQEAALRERDALIDEQKALIADLRQAAVAALGSETK